MVRRRTPVSEVDPTSEHRQRVSAQDLPPIQIWVSDVRSPEFPTKAHEQSLAVTASNSAADDRAFIDAVSLDEGCKQARCGRCRLVFLGLAGP